MIYISSNKAITSHVKVVNIRFYKLRKYSFTFFIIYKFI